MNDDRAGERSLTHGALAVASRLRLLDALRASERPLDVRELAAASGLHVTTARFHLDVLADAGLVISRAGPAGARGRPRRLYLPASHAAGGSSGYELLSGILAAHWAGDGDERARRAERAGWDWADQRKSRPVVAAATLTAAAAHVNAVFLELGFDPDLAGDGDRLEIRLHACPFRAVAEMYPDVVCSLHLGLLRKTLADVDAPPATVSLQPFVQPHLCLAQITPATAPIQRPKESPPPGTEGTP